MPQAMRTRSTGTPSPPDSPPPPPENRTRRVLFAGDIDALTAQVVNDAARPHRKARGGKAKASNSSRTATASQQAQAKAQEVARKHAKQV